MINLCNIQYYNFNKVYKPRIKIYEILGVVIYVINDLHLKNFLSKNHRNKNEFHAKL